MSEREIEWWWERKRTRDRERERIRERERERERERLIDRERKIGWGEWWYSKLFCPEMWHTFRGFARYFFEKNFFAKLIFEDDEIFDTLSRKKLGSINTNTNTTSECWSNVTYVILCLKIRINSILPFNLKWWGHQTDHRVMEQEVFYLPTLLKGCGVVERHLAMA